MNIYIYSDESGVFDKLHYDYFSFGGLVVIGNEEKEILSRKFSAAEKSINADNKYGDGELKASKISVKDKNKLFRTLNNTYKFAFIIHLQDVMDEVYIYKKDKQRYLDYVYCEGITRVIKELISEGIINEFEVNNIYFNVDEHSTATNGEYELEQLLENSFVNGSFNYDFTRYFPPLLPCCKSTDVVFCNSSTKLLVRASDIVANKINYCVTNDKMDGLQQAFKMKIIEFPLNDTK